MRRWVKRILLVVVVAGVGGAASLLAFLWVEHRAALELPSPSGPFPVGRITEVWSDPQRPDSFAGAPNGSRTELVVWIWYPSAAAVGQRPAAYLPAGWRRVVAPRGLLALLTRKYSVIHGHSIRDGPLARRGAPYPVVILRAGGGALTVEYTTLAEDLASHGYVVVGFDAPYRTFGVVLAGGKVVWRPANLNPENLRGEALIRLGGELAQAWASDMSFVLDRLARLNASPRGKFFDRLDLQKVGAVGHSLGGAAAAEFCREDPRVRAGVDLDGRLFDPVIRDGLDRPFLFLLEDLDDAPAHDPEGRKIVSEILSVYTRLPASTRAGFWVRGANHFSFTDFLLERSLLVRVALRCADLLDLEPRRGLRLIDDVVRCFLDVHLKGIPARTLQALPARYPEVQPLPVPARHSPRPT